MCYEQLSCFDDLEQDFLQESDKPLTLAFWREAFDTYAQVTDSARKSDKRILTWIKEPYSESAEYKMWGNGVALPCVYYVMRGIAHAERTEI